MGGLERRLECLEQKREDAGSGEEVSEESRRTSREFWKMEVEDVALDLVRGDEPESSVDEAGNFYEPGEAGRRAVGPEHMDFQVLFNREATEKRASSIPEGRWERFLAADETAAEILDRLRARAEDAEVPDAHKMPNHRWHDQAEVRVRSAAPHGVGGSIFADAEEREATRRMTWLLTYDPEAMRQLSELLRRRDAFAADQE